MPDVEKINMPSSDPTMDFRGISLTLRREKVLWIKDLSTLLIADLHFGKASHFRKSGIPIPEPIHDADLIRLQKLHEDLMPTHTYFLGDLFHSEWNDQWQVLNQFLRKFEKTTFHLVKGNHDVLSPIAYSQSILEIHDKPLVLGNLILSHEPLENVPDDFLNICGHIHPGYRFLGKARQSLRLPCFHLSQFQLILPAFGNFTGLALVKPKSDDKIWAVGPEKIIPVLSGTSIG